MAGCPARDTALIVPMVNLDTCCVSAGTSLAWTEAGVGGGVDGESVTDTSTRLSLAEKLVLLPWATRAHPSGILTDTNPPAGVKGTYAWLSGMSPGGFDSVATGPDPDVGVGCVVDPAVGESAADAVDMATDEDDDRSVEPGGSADDADLSGAFLLDDPPARGEVDPMVGPAIAVAALESTAELIDPDPAAGLEAAGVAEHPAIATVTAAAAAATIALLGMSMTPPRK